MTSNLGVVYLVGAGPGDPGLITVRGLQLLARADVVLHDRLIGRELLASAPPGAEIIDVRRTCGRGPDAQKKINAILVDRAAAGRTVVRLKGGDPFVFGRGWEEWRACRDAGIPCAVVSGVTSAIAAPATAGVPITLRGAGRTFTVITARSAGGDDGAGLDYDALARMDTLVIMMGRSNLAEVARRLVSAGSDPSTPAVCVERGTTSKLRYVVATLATIAEAADREILAAPVVTVVGEVARCAAEYREFIDAIDLPPFQDHKPLVGKRIVITRSADSSTQLRNLLSEAGATVIEAPMIRVDYSPEADALDEAIRSLEDYEWIAFASVHGVRGFFKRLTVMGRDARALAACKVAAIGPVTASALQKRGISPELVSQAYSTDSLAKGILKRGSGRAGRILCPCGEAAGSELSLRLRRAGAIVDDVVTYEIHTLTPPEHVLRIIRDGVDAVLLCSPSAAGRFAALRLNPADAVVACMGPSTASAAREAGMSVEVVAHRHTDDGLVEALRCHLNTVPSHIA